MTLLPSKDGFAAIHKFYWSNASRSLSSNAGAYIEPRRHRVDFQEVIGKTWQWFSHVEKRREQGRYVTVESAAQSIALVREREGVLRAFDKVCKHRAHALLQGEGPVHPVSRVRMTPGATVSTRCCRSRTSKPPKASGRAWTRPPLRKDALSTTPMVRRRARRCRQFHELAGERERSLRNRIMMVLDGKLFAQLRQMRF